MERIARHRKGKWLPDCLKLQLSSENVQREPGTYRNHVELDSFEAVLTSTATKRREGNDYGKRRRRLVNEPGTRLIKLGCLNIIRVISVAGAIHPTIYIIYIYSLQ